MPSPLVAFRTTPEQKAEVERLALKGGVSISEVIKACITRALPYIEGRIDERLTQAQKDSTVNHA